MPIYEVWVKAQEVTEVERLYTVEADSAEEAEHLYHNANECCEYHDSYSENLIEVQDIEVLRVVKSEEED